MTTTTPPASANGDFAKRMQDTCFTAFRTLEGGYVSYYTKKLTLDETMAQVRAVRDSLTDLVDTWEERVHDDST